MEQFSRKKVFQTLNGAWNTIGCAKVSLYILVCFYCMS